MKKYVILISLLLSFAGSAFAGAVSSGALDTNVPTGAAGGLSVFGGSTSGNAASATGPLIRLSNKVVGVVNFDKVSQSSGLSAKYCIFAKHAGGSKIFGTGSDTTAMYFKQAPALILSDSAVANSSISLGDYLPTAFDGADFINSTKAWTSL